MNIARRMGEEVNADTEHAIRQGKAHCIVAALDGNALRLTVDGVVVHGVHDSSPLLGADHEHVGFCRSRDGAAQSVRVSTHFWREDAVSGKRHRLNLMPDSAREETMLHRTTGRTARRPQNFPRRLLLAAISLPLAIGAWGTAVRAGAAPPAGQQELSAALTADPRLEALGPRPLVSEDHKTIRVPGDYDTPQEAIDHELAVIMRHQLRIVVEPEDDAHFANHHVRIPAFLSDVSDGDALRPYNGTPGVGGLRMYGKRPTGLRTDPDVTAPTQLGSVWIAGGIKGLNAVTVEAFNIMNHVPRYRRQFGIVVYGDTSANIWDISFLNSNAQNGIEAYEATLDIRRMVGGNRDLIRLFRQKGAGFTAIGFKNPSIPRSQHIKADWGVVHVRRSTQVPLEKMQYSSFDGGFIFDQRTGQMLDFESATDLSQVRGIRFGAKRLNDGTVGLSGWYWWDGSRWRAEWDRDAVIEP